MTILEKIIANKKKELAPFLTKLTPVKELEKSELFQRETISLSTIS